MENYGTMNRFDLGGLMTRKPFFNGAGPVCDIPKPFSMRRATARFFRMNMIPHT